jgi:hypothetical protein
MSSGPVGRWPAGGASSVEMIWVQVQSWSGAVSQEGVQRVGGAAWGRRDLAVTLAWS